MNYRAAGCGRGGRPGCVAQLALERHQVAHAFKVAATLALRSPLFSRLEFIVPALSRPVGGQRRGTARPCQGGGPGPGRGSRGRLQTGLLLRGVQGVVGTDAAALPPLPRLYPSTPRRHAYRHGEHAYARDHTAIGVLAGQQASMRAGRRACALAGWRASVLACGRDARAADTCIFRTERRPCPAVPAIAARTEQKEGTATQQIRAGRRASRVWLGGRRGRRRRRFCWRSLELCYAGAQGGYLGCEGVYGVGQLAQGCEGVECGVTRRR